MFSPRDLHCRPAGVLQQPADFRLIELIWLPAVRNVHYAQRNPTAQLGGYPPTGTATRFVAVHHQHQLLELIQ
jgi:hypothetical protein